MPGTSPWAGRSHVLCYFLQQVCREVTGVGEKLTGGMARITGLYRAHVWHALDVLTQAHEEAELVIVVRWGTRTRRGLNRCQGHTAGQQGGGFESRQSDSRPIQPPVHTASDGPALPPQQSLCPSSLLWSLWPGFRTQLHSLFPAAVYPVLLKPWQGIQAFWRLALELSQHHF